MSMDWQQVARFGGDLTRVEQRVGPLAQLVLRKAAVDTKADAKRIARAKGVYDTGFLTTSISHTDLRTVGTSGSMAVEIGPEANYGVYHELGTSKMPARPYMGPAADRNGPLLEQALAQLGGDLLSG